MRQSALPEKSVDDGERCPPRAPLVPSRAVPSSSSFASSLFLCIPISSKCGCPAVKASRYVPPGERNALHLEKTRARADFPSLSGCPPFPHTLLLSSREDTCWFVIGKIQWLNGSPYVEKRSPALDPTSPLCPLFSFALIPRICRSGSLIESIFRKRRSFPSSFFHRLSSTEVDARSLRVIALPCRIICPSAALGGYTKLFPLPNPLPLQKNFVAEQPRTWL